jgi:hypothetical protein
MSTANTSINQRKDIPSIKQTILEQNSNDKESVYARKIVSEDLDKPNGG